MQELVAAKRASPAILLSVGVLLPQMAVTMQLVSEMVAAAVQLVILPSMAVLSKQMVNRALRESAEARLLKIRLIALRSAVVLSLQRVPTGAWLSELITAVAVLAAAVALKALSAVLRSAAVMLLQSVCRAPRESEAAVTRTVR